MTQTQTQKGGNGAEARAPAGFSDLPGEFEGWWKPTKDEPLLGKILGFEPKQNQPGFLYVVKLAAPATVVPVGEKEPVTLGAGAIVAVDEKKALERLRPYVEHQCDVWILPLGTTKTRSGNTFWRFKLSFKGRAGRIPEIALQASAEGGDAPF
ncbi:MAG: hypothetical protein DWQ35_00465 [Planctomycetota bacterium]|nr:MAG: hypothetical protein DWQ35_00465 [Planctomycetota bacterium]